MMTKLAGNTLYPNGNCKANSGFRSVVFSPSYTIRPVVRAVRSGYHPDRTTFQKAHDGDFRITVTWYPEVWAVEQYCDGTWYPIEERQGENIKCLTGRRAREFIANASPALVEWLHLRGRSHSMLPEGAGWDGANTLNDIRKDNKVKTFFAGTEEGWLENLVLRARVSKFSGLPMEWQFATRPLPVALEAPAEQVDGSVVSINTYTSWVLWYEDGRVDVITPSPTTGGYRSNYAHTPGRKYDTPEIPMPIGVVKAAKVVFGAYTNEHFSYGVKWELFRR